MNMISFGLLLTALFVGGYSLSGQKISSAQFWLSILGAMLMIAAAILMQLGG